MEAGMCSALTRMIASSITEASPRRSISCMVKTWHAGGVQRLALARVEIANADHGDVGVAQHRAAA